MSKIKEGLEEIAIDLFRAVEGPYTKEDFLILVTNTYRSMQAHYGENFPEISEDAILKVIRQQMVDVIRYKRIHKLLKKSHHIADYK